MAHGHVIHPRVPLPLLADQSAVCFRAPPGPGRSKGPLARAQRSVPAAIVSAGIELRRFETGEVSLEEVFVDLVSENGE